MLDYDTPNFGKIAARFQFSEFPQNDRKPMTTFSVSVIFTRPHASTHVVSKIWTDHVIYTTEHLENRCGLNKTHDYMGLNASIK